MTLMPCCCSPELQILEHLASSGFNELTSSLQKQWQLEEGLVSVAASTSHAGTSHHGSSKVGHRCLYKSMLIELDGAIVIFGSLGTSRAGYTELMWCGLAVGDGVDVPRGTHTCLDNMMTLESLKS